MRRAWAYRIYKEIIDLGFKIVVCLFVCLFQIENKFRDETHTGLLRCREFLMKGELVQSPSY